MLLSAVFLTVGATVDGTDASEEEMRLAEQTQQTTREVVVRDGGRFNKS